ncbi:MAG: hypothetical protein ABEJ23_05310 [Haloarculaceae archaeon]
MDQSLVGLAVVSLVVLAGCSGLVPSAPGGPATPTVTPAPVPPTPPAAEPFVDAAGTVDGGALARAHAARLRDTSFTVATTRTATYRNGSLASRLDVRLRVPDTDGYSVSVAVAGPAGPEFLGRPPARATFWSNGTVYVRRLDAGDRTIYNRFDPPFDYAGTRRYWLDVVALDGPPRRDVEGAFGSFRTRVTARTRDGDATVYRVVGTNPRSTGFVDDNEDVAAVRDASLAARVTAAGLVRSYRVTYTAETPTGAVVSVTRRVRYERVGNTTVSRPAWYARAVGDETDRARQARPADAVGRGAASRAASGQAR